MLHLGELRQGFEDLPSAVHHLLFFPHRELHDLATLSLQRCNVVLAMLFGAVIQEAKNRCHGEQDEADQPKLQTAYEFAQPLSIKYADIHVLGFPFLQP